MGLGARENSGRHDLANSAVASSMSKDVGQHQGHGSHASEAVALYFVGSLDAGHEIRRAIKESDAERSTRRFLFRRGLVVKT